MRSVFDRLADCNSKQGLSSAALMAALKEVQAPVVLSFRSSEPDGSVNFEECPIAATTASMKEAQARVALEEDIFRRADTNLSGSVDFEECETDPCEFVMCADSIFKVLARGSAARRVGDAFGG